MLLFMTDAHDGVTRILVYRAAHRVHPDWKNMPSKLKCSKSARVKLLFVSDAHDGVNRILVYRTAHRVCSDRDNMRSSLFIMSKFFWIMLV